MSVRAMTWVFYDSAATGTDRLVLLALADEANDEGLNCWPSLPTIAHKARVSRSTAIRAVARLEAGGQLLVNRPEHKGRGRHNRYAVVMGRDPVALAARCGWPAPVLDPAVVGEWAADAASVPAAGPIPERSQADTITGGPPPPVDNPGPGPEKVQNGVIRGDKRSAQVTPDALDPETPRVRTRANPAPMPPAPTPDRFVRSLVTTPDGDLVGANLDGPVADAHAGATAARAALTRRAGPGDP